MNVIVATPDYKFLPVEKLTTARELAHWLEKDAGMPGTALTINLLVADIESYRDAFKGATIVINQAGQMLRRQDAATVAALNDTREALRTVALTQLKLSALFVVAEKLHPVIDDEIEQRKAGGNAEDWAALQALSDELHAAIRLVSR